MHFGADARIERTEGFVEQQDFRFLDQRLRDGEPLLHATGKFGRIFAHRLFETDAFQHVERAGSRLAPRPPEEPRRERAAGKLQPEHHILQRRQMRKNRILLEDDAAVRRRLGFKRDAVDKDAALCRRLVAQHHAQKGRLAAARRPHQRDKGTGRDVEGDVLQHRLVAIDLPQFLDGNLRQLPFPRYIQRNAAR